MVPRRRVISDKRISMFPMAPKSPAKKWSGMAHFGPRATVKFYRRRVCCEPPGFGPGIGRPAGNIADIRKLLTFDRIRNGSETAQERLDKTIKNTPARTQTFIQECLAIMEGLMANTHGAEEHWRRVRAHTYPWRIRNI
jgi:hypothetical protein